MKYIENIVVGNPIVEPSIMFAANQEDWDATEMDRTYYTEERFLPRILVDLGIYPSVSEIRRNKPNFVITLDNLSFINKLKVSKKRYIWVLVGE